MANNYAGVFVTEKFTKKSTSLQGVVGAGAFIGVTKKGEKDTPILVTSYEEFTEKTGGIIKDNPLAYSVYAFFSEGGGRAYIINPKMDDSSLAEGDKDQLSEGAIFMSRMVSETSAISVSTFTRASVLFNKDTTVTNYLDYNGTSSSKVICNSLMEHIDLASLRVKIGDTIIGMSDKDGNIFGVANYIDTTASNELIKIKEGLTSAIDISTGDNKKMGEAVISIELEKVGTGATTNQHVITIEYVLINADLNYYDMTTDAGQVAGTSGPNVITITFNAASMVDNGSLTLNDFVLENLLITDGTNHVEYLPNTKELTDGTNSVGVDIASSSYAGGVLTLAVNADPTANFSFGGIWTATIKANISKQDSFYKNHMTGINSAGNNFYLLSSRYEANAYNEYFVRMENSGDYNDDYYNTVFVDADVYEEQYSDTGAKVTPLKLKDISKLSFDATRDDYFFTLFNDDLLGSDSMQVDINSQTVTVPLQLQNKPNGDVNGYYYGNTVIATGVTPTFNNSSDILGSDIVEIIKGSVKMRIGQLTGAGTSIVGTIIETYQDNGIGGFIKVSDPSVSLSHVSINYKTGEVIGLGTQFDSTAGITMNQTFIDFAYALTPVTLEQDYTVSYGAGGTNVQSAALSSAVTTDAVLEAQGRGIYALTKVQGEYIAWGIPHLATSYGIAVPCMEFCDNQSVKRFNYVWNLDDNLTEEEAGRYMKYVYTYRSKNSFVAYPFLNVEDIESTVIRSGKKKTVAIPYVGTIIGKIANRIGTAQPQESVAGKENGKINWGISPTRVLSPELTELLGDEVVPAVSNYDTGFVLWGDGSLADRELGFATISDTLVFGMVQYEIQALLWSFEFKVVNDDLIRRVQSTVNRYLLEKTKLGWFGETNPKDAFKLSMARNNKSTEEERKIIVDLRIALPFTLKQVEMTIARKN